ncbi:MAG: phosphotransferase [Kaiparowitsia implicata GSE-PSE-MK54-09C]|nr:phosphotransferase [Kaiparowitsia implicata GSE-PSE-MK54-09C]
MTESKIYSSASEQKSNLHYYFLSAKQISTLVERLAREELGQRIREALFAEKSVGAVFGFELSSGERVVLKLFHPSQLLTQLAAVHRCLNVLVQFGFPAPPPRSRLFQTEDRIVGIFYTFMAGTVRNAHEPIVRQELARVLAELTAILEHENPTGLPLAPTRGNKLWPASHRSFLKLDEDPEVEWIDEIARRAQAVIRAKAMPLMPAHLDWGVKNCRFHQNRVCVVYDWDSLCVASEAEMVGYAATQFTAQWDFQAPLTPSLAEARAFVLEYEIARGRPFSYDERIFMAASADYALAQAARIEFAYGCLPSNGFFTLLQNWRSHGLLEGLLIESQPT